MSGKRPNGLLQPVFAVLTVCLLSSVVVGETYYVSNDGDNQKDGKTEETAWETIAQAVSSARSGDNILLRRGDIFRESAEFSAGNLTIKDYGSLSSPRPVLSGSIQITGWTPWAIDSRILVTTTSKKIEQLFVNGRLMRIARFPNSGWLFTTTNNSNSTEVSCDELTGNQRNVNDYWNGCRMRWRHWSWYYDTRTISDYSSNGTISLDGTPVQDVGNGEAGWGFYIDGKLTELDTAGEWYYDSSSNEVYLFPPGNVDMTGALVEGLWDEAGMSVSGSNIENICFRHYKSTGLQVTRTTSVKGWQF